MNTVKMEPPMPAKCPQCGTPLPAGALAGLCPACLLRAGAAADTVSEPKQAAFNPPTVAELAAKFPQLEILELIGKGGMGAVYKARQRQLDRFVALKILPPGIGDDPAFAERFAREARALARLNHPGIVTIYDFGRADGLFYFFMEFVDGVNLRQLLHGGRVSPREALAIVPQICDALQFAHDQGIVHRDIKPENILLDRRGRVKVADFGLAKIMAGQGAEPAPAVSGAAPAPLLTESGKIMGTPQYMAPEQKEHPDAVDHRADIYALGVVFYQMLTGELPGKKIEPPSSKVQIDVRLDEVVLRALEQKPERRYQQASVLKTQVETIVATPDPGSGESQKDESGARKAAVERRFSRRTSVAIKVLTVIWATAVLIAITLHHLTLANANPITQSEFLDKFASNQIASATIVVNQQALPLEEIKGTYYRLDKSGKPTTDVVPFVVHNAWLTQEQLNLVTHSPKISTASGPNVVLNLLWGVAPFLIVGIILFLCPLIVVIIVIYGLWRAAKKSAAPSASPPVQKPDRFWRRFAIAVFAFISIPFVIAIIGTLAAIAIPNFVKARQHSQQLAAQQGTEQGWQLWQSGKYAEAEIKFRRAVELAPQEASAWNGLGWSQFDSGNRAGAEDSFNRAIAIQTNLPGALNGLGQIYLSEGKFPEAEKYLLQASTSAPAAWFGLARLYLLQGKFAEAEPWAQKIVDSGQGDETAQKMLAAAKSGNLSDGLPAILETPPAVQGGGLSSGNSQGGTSVPVVPVEAAKAYRGDIGVHIQALGVVAPPINATSPPPVREGSPAVVFFSIAEDDVQTVVKSLDAGKKLGVEISGRDGKPLGTGVLVGVDNQIDPQTETLKCRASVQPGADVLLYPNQFVNVRLQLETKHGVTLVPFTALQVAASGSTVMVLDSAGYASKRLVTQGVVDDGLVEITQGLSPGEIVVVNPNPNVQEGAKVSYHLVGDHPSASANLPAKTTPPAPATNQLVAETWSPTLAPGEKPDLQKILDEAKDLMNRQAYEESLQRHIWYHNHEAEYGDSYQKVVRVTSAISDWVELGRRYPKAKQALIEIRDQDTRKLADGRGYADLFTDVNAINHELQDDDATYALFKTIREKDPQLAGQCYFWVESLLVAKGEYQWCYDHMGDPQSRFDNLHRTFDMDTANQKRMAETQQRSRQMMADLNRAHGWTNLPAFSPPDTSVMIKKASDDRFVGQVRQLIEILVATGHEEEAEKIRGQAVAVLDDARLKSAISDAQEKTRKQKPASASDNDANPVLAEQPPVVVETSPVSGAQDVVPGETEIRVRFSRPMSDGSWSWSTAWEDSAPEFVGTPHYLDDHRTCVVKVRLEAGKAYGWWLNSEKFKNFRDQAGQPAVPYLFTFQTKTN
jgi:serine/threonine protein kinase/tetratricopeptide (TPR) repeat protein